MRRLGIIAVIGLGVGVAIATSRGETPSPLATPATRVAVVPSAAPSAPVFEIGVEHAYDASLAQTAQTQGVDFAVALTGTWGVTYAGTDERGLVFRAQLRDAKAKVRGADVPFAATPYFFTTTGEGRVIALHFAPGVDELARNALTTLATSFQVSRRCETCVESDSVGDYEARYVRSGTGLVRTRIRYQRVVGEDAIVAAIVKTGTTIELRTDGWPQSIAGGEATRVGTDDFGVTVDATLSLRHRATAKVEAGWYEGLEVVTVDAAAPRDSRAADLALVDGASLSDLIAATVGEEDAHARGYQFLRIAALLRLDGDAVRAAERSILANEPATQLLVAALGEAGTADAQRSLGTVLAAPIGEEPRMHAAIALGLVSSPTPAALAALASTSRQAGDIGASATLAQGNAALRLRDEDPAAASRQVDELLSRFRDASTDEERVLVLRALGNTGDPRIVQAVEQALASTNVIVRAAATEALRLVAAPIDGMLVARLRDASSAVRSAAVFAAAQRDLAPYVAAFATAVRTETDDDVRRAIVELAGARIDEHAALRAIVEYAAANDRDAELRARAQALLAT